MQHDTVKLINFKALFPGKDVKQHPEFFANDSYRCPEHMCKFSLISFINCCYCAGLEPHFLDLHSFIHYGDLYSAPSRLLLRSAPDPCTAKKKSFETRVECVRKILVWRVGWSDRHSKK